KLIEQAVAELKGEEWHEDINPEINVDIPAFLPGDYVIDTDVRLNLYRRLSRLREKSELETMADEIKDRFGPPPQEVRNLMGLISIRLLLERAGISRLDVSPESLTITFSQARSPDTERLVQLLNSRPNRLQLLPRGKLRVTLASLALPDDLSGIEKTIVDLGLD
ncbi:MAG: TRCF domain-containing protein, partial [Thermodesulfobacteriota bacterium]|nr:TRCF domain-containing protein [Thermodesulfobacteriota bacterium]